MTNLFHDLTEKFLASPENIFKTKEFCYDFVLLYLVVLPFPKIPMKAETASPF